MFMITPESSEFWVEALALLSNYHVAGTTYMDNNDPDTMYMAVINDHFESDDDVGLAEMAFQMNWHQSGKCPECADICGHMVFTKPIKPAF